MGHYTALLLRGEMIGTWHSRRETKSTLQNCKNKKNHLLIAFCPLLEKNSGLYLQIPFHFELSAANAPNKKGL
jgi:hypothetical protein